MQTPSRSQTFRSWQRFWAGLPFTNPRASSPATEWLGRRSGITRLPTPVVDCAIRLLQTHRLVRRGPVPSVRGRIGLYREPRPDCWPGHAPAGLPPGRGFAAQQACDLGKQRKVELWGFGFLTSCVPCRAIPSGSVALGRIPRGQAGGTVWLRLTLAGTAPPQSDHQVAYRRTPPLTRLARAHRRGLITGQRRRAST
jgi:hypothetical protein